MGKKRREELHKKSSYQEWKENRKSTKEMKIIRSEEDWIYRVKLQCMKEDDQTYDQINECCSSHPKYTLMVKYGRSWGRLLADPIHMFRHTDEFHASLTEEEAGYWKEAFGGKSLLTLWEEYRETTKAEKAKMKEAKKEAKKKGIDVKETEYFQGLVHDLKKNAPDLVPEEDNKTNRE